MHATTRQSARCAAPSAAPALLFLAFLAAAGGWIIHPPPAAAQYPDGPFPHILAVDHGAIDMRPEEIAAFDVFLSPWWNAEDAAAVLDSARALNPKLINLVYVNPLGLSVPDEGDPNHIVNRFLNGVADAWYMRNEQGELINFELWPHMPIMNLSGRCPRVGGKTWAEFMAEFVTQQVLSTGLYDGVHWDNMWGSLAWINDYIQGSLDLDSNGIPDPPDSVDTWWVQGYTDLARRFRELAGDQVLAEGNGEGPFYPDLNGRFYEAFPRGGWSANLVQADDWHQNGRSPALLLFATRGEIDDYRTVRFGLCSALLVGGVYWHEPPVTPFLNATIYDEFEVDLGYPQGSRQEIGFEEIVAYDLEAGLPAGLRQDCGYGRSWFVDDPDLVLDGARSLLGTADDPPRTWNTYLCTDAAVVRLDAGATYTVEFDYRVVTPPPAGSYFYLSARSATAGDVGIYNITPEAATTGHVRDTFTLGAAADYYLYFGVKDSGTIVIDDIRITAGQGGVFRRDFDRGLALVNPTDQPQTVDLGGTFYRIQGTQDPLTNNGEAVSAVSLAPQDGLVVLREPDGTPSGVENPPGEPGTGDGGGQAPPLISVPTVYPNPARLSEVPAVTFAGVPGGGDVQIFTVDGHLIRRLRRTGLDGRVGWDLRNRSARGVAPGLYVAVVRDAAQRPVRTLRLALRW